MTTTRDHRSATTTGAVSLADPGYQAFWALRIGFTVLPVLFGLDKFAELFTDRWVRYLDPNLDDLIPGNAETAMHLVGVVEIVAGVAVLLLPRWGAPLVAAWLVGIVVDLAMVGGYGDVALRDVGLFAAAVVLARLAWAYPNGLSLRR